VGTDTAVVDAGDVVSNCESVDRGPVGGGGPNGTAGCKVPKVRKGAKLKPAKRSLKRAGCKARTRKVKSRVKRGRVVKVAPKAGKRVAAGKKVTVYVSKGR
jgi:beta-lactam-binding protein with PASTA domain